MASKQYQTSSQLRQAFLAYFANHGHAVVPSSSLVPVNDPSLLFTNAGMVPFKDIFLGHQSPVKNRVASAQCCVRAGGKHNDLDNVGYTARHHTFFEMLGNFSFGDYFKKDAIHFCWDFLTNVLQLPASRLWISVYKDDKEAADIWLKSIKVDPNRFSYCDEEDNFWSMGQTGPCGPCTEVFYDHGEHIPGGPPGSVEADGDRYVEIWNLVFMQYNRDEQGQLTPLPKPAVDTGMGLERIAAVMQGVHNNYDIDVFSHLIKAIAALIGKPQDTLSRTSLCVIADHIRSSSFLISDGVIPGNEGRGYVLRRIIRRAVRHGNQLGFTAPFFHQLVKPLIDQMGTAYPQLQQRQCDIEAALLAEETQFASTLSHGLAVFEKALGQLSGNTIPAAVVFQLYDTYGFPADLTADIARERNLHVDMSGFEREMAAQRRQSKANSRFTGAPSQSIQIDAQTDFTGYHDKTTQANITALFVDHQAVDTLGPDQSAMVVLNKTPFYAESGGQVGDIGELIGEAGCFVVQDTQKVANAICHIGMVKHGRLKVGDTVNACIDQANRNAIVLNHSATHLLHAALRQVLGEHVTQRGSLVEAKRLRFDFSHANALTSDQIATIERLVNAKIRENTLVETVIMSQEAAMKAGAMALFGEKYAEKVRVLTMGDFSKELCGGTHVKRTGDIGLFKITLEAGVAAGIRRIEALTGGAAFEWVLTCQATLQRTAELVRSNISDCDVKVVQLIQDLRDQDKQIKQLSQKLATQEGRALMGEAKQIGDVHVLIKTFKADIPKDLRHLVDQLKQQWPLAVIVLVAVEQTHLRLIAGVTCDLTDKIKAGELIKQLACDLGGKGGGRADFAQGAGTDVAALDKALDAIWHHIKTQLGVL